jgi:hypothetical protein
VDVEALPDTQTIHRGVTARRAVEHAPIRGRRES